MPLDPNKFTKKTGEALQSAQSLARERNHAQVAPEHLLAALLGQPEGVVLPVLEKLGVAPKTLRDRVDEALGAAAPGLRRGPAGPALPRRVPGARSRRRGRAPTSATTTSRRSTSSSP